MNGERSSFCVSYDDQKKEIYVFGGIRNGFDILNQSEKYSIDNDQWTEIAPTAQKKWGSSACILNNESIYIIGGSNLNGFLIDIEKYSISLNTMETIHITSDQQLPSRYYALSFCISPSCILIAGGNNNREYLKGCYIFDTKDNSLKKTNELP